MGRYDDTDDGFDENNDDADNDDDFDDDDADDDYEQISGSYQVSGWAGNGRELAGRQPGSFYIGIMILGNFNKNEEIFFRWSRESENIKGRQPGSFYIGIISIKLKN